MSLDDHDVMELFGEHFTLVITEYTTTSFEDQPERNTFTKDVFRVSTRKLQEWVTNPLTGELNHGSLMYVYRIFHDALVLKLSQTRTSRKYSLGDTKDWWVEFLITPEQDTDPVKYFEVDIEYSY